MKAGEVVTAKDIEAMLKAQGLAKRGILPGKTFEYLRYGRPVLALGPTNGEVARVLGRAGDVLHAVEALRRVETLRRRDGGRPPPN
jgi:Flp pilus assembly protein TadD